jgi:ADP-heptose:LPS heptosyltransferase
MFHLGVERQPVPRARLFAERARSLRPYAVLHPFAATSEKTWPPERFIAVADHLERRQGLEPVFLAGPGADVRPFERFRIIAGAHLGDVKSLLAGASLFIGNDSGPAHMAAAFGVPVVVLFGPSDPVIWAPWQVEAETLTGNGIIDSIPVEQVIHSIDQLRVAR